MVGSITLFQALFCGFWYYFVGNCCWNFSLGFNALAKGLVTGLIIGIVMGQPIQGMLIGSHINLIYIGNIHAGGTAPNDSNAATILGTAFGLANNLTPELAIAVAVPLGIIFNFRNIFHMTFNATFAHRGMTMAENGDRSGLFRWQVLLPQLGYFVTGFTPVFLACMFGSEAVGTALKWLEAPEWAWIMKGLLAMGGAMPALGICMNLSVIGNKETIPFFILGFICVMYFKLSTIVITILAGIIAYVAVVGTGVHGVTMEDVALDTGDAEASKERKLVKGDITKSFVNWTLFAHSCYNYETLQALSFCFSISNCLEKLYSGDEFAASLSRHTVFFNTNPTYGSIILGVAIAMEEEKALGGAVTDEAITGVKTGLMGPIAGVGDTLGQGIMTPLFSGIFISMAIDTQSVIAPILFVLLNGGISIVLSYVIIHYGYKFGTNAVESILNSGLMNIITGAAGIVGCMVLGAMSAQFVNVKTPLQWELIAATGEEGSEALAINLQKDFFDRLFLGLLPLATTLILLRLMKKRVNINKLLFGLIIVSFVLGALGVISN